MINAGEVSVPEHSVPVPRNGNEKGHMPISTIYDVAA